MHEGIAQLAKLYPNCFRQPRQPLKIGIHNDIVARHPELRPSLIASALKTYTRSLGYLETLTAGAARIDLEGNPVGSVTAADEEDASGRSPRRPSVPRLRRSKTARRRASPRPNLLRTAPGNKTQSRKQNLDSWRGPNRLSGWLASRPPRRLAGRGSSPRSDPGSVAP